MVISSPETLHVYEWVVAPNSLPIFKSKLLVCVGCCFVVVAIDDAVDVVLLLSSASSWL